MTATEFEGMLKKHNLAFFWNEPNKIWWVRKTNPDGQTIRSNPTGAKNKEAAETAATKLIQRQFR